MTPDAASPAPPTSGLPPMPPAGPPMQRAPSKAGCFVAVAVAILLGCLGFGVLAVLACTP